MLALTIFATITVFFICAGLKGSVLRYLLTQTIATIARVQPILTRPLHINHIWDWGDRNNPFYFLVQFTIKTTKQ